MYLEGHVDDGFSASDYCHKDHDECDGCGKSAPGTMLYSTGATGRICAVLFLCKTCDPESYEKFPVTPPAIEGQKYGSIHVPQKGD